MTELDEAEVGESTCSLRTSSTMATVLDLVIEVIDSIFKLHRTTPPDTEALEAPKPR